MARALPTPSSVAYSHRANKISGAIAARPEPPSTARIPSYIRLKSAWLDIGPDDTRAVSFRQGRFQIARAQLNSRARLGPSHPRDALAYPVDGWRPGALTIRVCFKQLKGLVHYGA
jgi:hypothetical protein